MPYPSLDFARTVVNVHGDAGRRWLHEFPAILDAACGRWGLELGEPYAISYNYVVPALRADGVAVVLKLGVPCRELLTEIAALRLFDGRGSVRLLDADEERGLLLLEKLDPGTSLLEVGDDDEATRIAAGAMRALGRAAPAGHPFPTLADWCAGFGRLRQSFGGGTGPLPERLVEAAESAAADLLASSPDPVVLHGDLHHGNLLRARRSPWLAIDPKGIVGDPAFEPSAFLENPEPRPAAVLRRRIAIFADALGFDPDRVRAWGLVRAVLSAWWSIEDGEDGWDGAIVVGERLC